MPVIHLLNLSIRLSLPGRDANGNYTSPTPVNDTMLFVWDVCDEHDKPILAPCGRYDKFNYIEHKDERATRERLAAALPDYAVRGASYSGKQCRFEAVVSVPLPFYPGQVTIEIGDL